MSAEQRQREKSRAQWGRMTEEQRIATIAAAVDSSASNVYEVADKLDITDNAARVYLIKAAQADRIRAVPAIGRRQGRAGSRQFFPLENPGGKVIDLMVALADSLSGNKKTPEPKTATMDDRPARP